MKIKFKAIITSITATVILGSSFALTREYSPQIVEAKQKSTHHKKKTKTKKSKNTLLSRAKKLKYGMKLTTVKRIMKVKPTEEEENENGFVNLTYGNDKVILGFDKHKKLTSAPIGASQITKQGEKYARQHIRNKN